jgi:hypothetical protein
MKAESSVSKTGGFFYCPDEAMYHRDSGPIMLECGQIIRKVTNQRRSAIRAGPTGSDKADSVNVVGVDCGRLHAPLTRRAASLLD